MGLRTHYDNLQVLRNASPEVIKAAYRTLSQKHHPDRNPPDKREECERIMKILNVAYETLIDPVERQAHDLWIKSKEEPAAKAQASQARSDTRSEPKRPPEPPPPTIEKQHLMPGSIAWSELPQEVRTYLRSSVVDPALHGMAAANTFPVARIFWGYALSAFILWMVWVFAADERWTGQDEAVSFGFSFAAITFAGFLTWRIVMLRQTPLGSRLIVCPTHVVSAESSTLHVWPMLGISRFQATASPTRTNGDGAIRIDFEHEHSRRRRFTLAHRVEAQRVYSTVQGALKAFSAGGYNAFAKAFVASPLYKLPLAPQVRLSRSTIQQSASIAVGGLAIAAVFHLAVIRPVNASARQMQGIPAQQPVSVSAPPFSWSQVMASPRYQAMSPAEQLDEQVRYFNEFVAPHVTPADRNNALGRFLHTYPVAGMPSEALDRAAGLVSPADAGASEAIFDEPPRGFPRSGWLQSPHRGLIAPLKIVSGSADNYFLKLVDGDGKTVGTLFLRGGSSLNVDAPLGTYTLKYAYGKTWYGPQYLFGPETRYVALNSTFSFERKGDEVSGVEISLLKQKNGNLDDHPIAVDDF